MADRAISELIAASQVTPTDLFVLEQSGTAKKLTGQILENWLVSFADGHGGIQSIVKHSTSGLKDTYRITLADTTTFDFIVTNGKAISSVKQTSVSGLTRTHTIAFNDGTSQTFTVTDGRSIIDITKTATNVLTDTYTISYNDGTTSTFTVKNGKGIKSFAKVSTVGLVDTYRIEYTDNSSSEFTVTNGEKGDKGDNTYTHIKFASQEPTASSHSMGDVPDKWIDFYWGNSEEAPTDWTLYKWYQFKGDQGDTGDPARLNSSTVDYQVSDSGTIIPSGSWQTSVPVVAQGKYLWTRTTNTFNTGSPVVSYSVSRMGLDGSGSVSSVANISPDENGNVPLSAADLHALSNMGGDLMGELKMNGQPISGLNPPSDDTQAANKGYVDTAKEEAKTYTNDQAKKAAPRNLLDNSDWRVKELIVNQRGLTTWNTATVTIDRWKMFVDIGTINLVSNGIELDATSKAITFGQRFDDAVSNRMFASGKKYTVAVNYTVAVSGSNITLFQGLKDNSVKTIGALDKTVGTHTAVFVFTPNGASGDNTYCPFHLFVQSGNKLTLHWAALYEGEYNLDTLPEYQPKGYAVELAECQRYYYRINAWFHLGFGIVDWDGINVVITVPVGTIMRKIPSIPENITVQLRMGKYETAAITGKKPVVNIGGNIVSLMYEGVFSANDGRAYQPVIAQIEGTPMEFIADL